MAAGLLIPLAGSIYSAQHAQNAAALVFLIFFCVVLIFFCAPFLIFFYLITKKSALEKKKVAQILGVASTNADWGLTAESGFLLVNEKKIHYFPTVWFIPSLRNVPKVVAGYRASIMLTDKRIIILGPKGLSLYFPNKTPVDRDSLIFGSLEKTKYPGDHRALRYVGNQSLAFFGNLMNRRVNEAIDKINPSNNVERPGLWVDGIKVWYYIPESKTSSTMKLTPTSDITEKQKQGYILDRLWLFPEDIDGFIEKIEAAKSPL